MGRPASFQALLGALGLAALLLPVTDAHALRFTLGLETSLTPLVTDAGELAPLRLGLRPVLDVEVSRTFAVGAYTPFTYYSAGASSGTGADSIFGLGVSGRYPILRADAPEEVLLYATARGGLGTVDGRAGAFLGVALGVTATWLDVGRGGFVELSVGRVGIAEGGVDRPFPAVERWLVGLSLGFVFRLGGEDWRLPR
jgi:hypothetical protein